MVSRIFSLERLGSSANPGSSRTQRCRSVKRTVSGSTPGCFSTRSRAMSSMSVHLSGFAVSAIARASVCCGLRPPSLLRRPEAFRFGLVPFLGMLVVPRPLRFLGDLVDDVLAGDLGLAAEPRGGLHVESAVEDVRLVVLLIAERIESL